MIKPAEATEATACAPSFSIQKISIKSKRINPKKPPMAGSAIPRISVNNSLFFGFSGDNVLETICTIGHHNILGNNI